jgi:hypothetical protein
VPPDPRRTIARSEPDWKQYRLALDYRLDSIEGGQAETTRKLDRLDEKIQAEREGNLSIKLKLAAIMALGGAGVTAILHLILSLISKKFGS